MFDENLFRQNEILRQGYLLARYSYSHLQSVQWREIIQESLRDLFGNAAPELLSKYFLTHTRLFYHIKHVGISSAV